MKDNFRYIMGVDAGFTNNGIGAFCIFDRIDNSVVEIKTSNNENEFKRDIEKMKEKYVGVKIYNEKGEWE